MPTQREDHGAAVVGGSLFAVGGTNPSQTILAVTEKYSHSLDSWTSVKSVPSNRYCLADSAVRAIGTMLVVIGGYGTTPAQLDNAFEMYTPSTDTWATKTAMPTSRIWHGIVAIGARIYAIGGTDPAESTPFKSVEVWSDTTSYAQITISRASPVNAASTYTGAMSISGINFASLDQTPSSFASRAIMRYALWTHRTHRVPRHHTSLFSSPRNSSHQNVTLSVYPVPTLLHSIETDCICLDWQDHFLDVRDDDDCLWVIGRVLAEAGLTLDVRFGRNRISCVHI
jgi:hypothetical protein